MMKFQSFRGGSSSNMTLKSLSVYQLTYFCTTFIATVALILTVTSAQVDEQYSNSVGDDFTQLLRKCRMDSEDFDGCIKDVLNDLRPYFTKGVPHYNINPFDPHRAAFVELRRGNRDGIGNFKLILRNVSEYGWSRSVVTKYRTDFDNKRLIYSQYFPEKSLEGYYEVSGKLLGNKIRRNGFWNMTLNDYSQTTSVRRLGGSGALLKVHVEVDHLGGLKMHISNFLVEGRQRVDYLTDGIINMMWPIGFPFIKPIINELVSTAFTDIFNESFRYFPAEQFFS